VFLRLLGGGWLLEIDNDDDDDSGDDDGEEGFAIQGTRFAMRCGVCVFQYYND